MISITLIDDNNFFRKSFITLLNVLKKYPVLYDFKSGKDFFEFFEINKIIPNIVFVDYKMPDQNGISITKQIKKKYPSIKVIGLSIFQNDYVVSGLIAAGANGYLSKNLEVQTIENAIEEVLEDRYIIEFMPGKIETYSNVEMARKLKKINCYFEITDRQIEFLKYCASEFTYKEIGEKMNISHKTVEKHRDLLFSKLNVNTRIELAIFSIQSGITDNFR